MGKTVVENALKQLSDSKKTGSWGGRSLDNCTRWVLIYLRGEKKKQMKTTHSAGHPKVREKNPSGTWHRGTAKRGKIDPGTFTGGKEGGGASLRLLQSKEGTTTTGGVPR